MEAVLLLRVPCCNPPTCLSPGRSSLSSPPRVYSASTTSPVCYLGSPPEPLILRVLTMLTLGLPVQAHVIADCRGAILRLLTRMTTSCPIRDLGCLWSSSGSGEESDPSAATQAYVIFLGQSYPLRHIVIESG